MLRRIPAVGEYLLCDIPGMFGELLWSDDDSRWDLYSAGDAFYRLADSITIQFIDGEVVIPIDYTRDMNLEWVDEHRVWVLQYPASRRTL